MKYNYELKTLATSDFGLSLLAFISGVDLPIGTTILPPPELYNTIAKSASTCARVEEMGNEAFGPSGGVDSCKQSASRAGSLSHDQAEIETYNTLDPAVQEKNQMKTQEIGQKTPSQFRGCNYSRHPHSYDSSTHTYMLPLIDLIRL
ncbi:hypothetical protein L2E82_18250 [Cichorium intybus]|uniref:Uncharacterized protein n=1 Tax=Cichorium intybus TaxID=13427 RepID=A0ACB9FAL1_CICIN|nr:hypothetical protein L2E82_18250 [Cichorium intybus]